MLKHLSVVTFLMVICLFFYSPSLHATGLGIQIPSIGSGSAHYEVDWDNDGTTEDDLDISHVGFGFVLDTRVANPGVFNYRLNLNYENADLGNEDQWGDGFSRFAIDNTFGFAVLQSPVVRMWLGPQIRIAYMKFSQDNYYSEVNSIGFAFAPVLGANFNLGSVVSLCPELGYRFSFYVGSLTFDEEYMNEEGTWTMNNNEFFLRFNILFRINDYYDKW
jgi:hypothetical protein